MRLLVWTYHSAIPALFIGILTVAAACGDLQDPATGGSVPVTHLVGQPATDPASSSSAAAQGSTEQSQEQGPVTTSQGAQVPGEPTSEQNQGKSLQTASPGAMKSVTLGWDPSVSQDVLGYKVYLVAVSSSAQQIIDVGSRTELALSLTIGERYGFTVTAYNASFESEALPHLLFQVF